MMTRLLSESKEVANGDAQPIARMSYVRTESQLISAIALVPPTT